MTVASVINPYQKFYALDGITPLSGGSIVLYENRTTDLLAIYSDANLTVPQDNPYNLDAGGAINGDIYFAPLATLVSFDGPDGTGAEINSFDDVTCFDQSTPFAPWEATTVYDDDGSSGTIVQSLVDSNYYISIDAPNLNHEPSVSPLWWEPLGDYLIRVQNVVAAGYVAIGNASTGLAGVNINAKGSLIVGNGTLPVALAVGTDAYALIADAAEASGVKWAPIDLVRDYQAITTSSNWTKPDNATFVYVELFGGGGGGANLIASGGDLGGGGGGEYVAALFQASALAATVSVTIGAGGAGHANASDGNGSVGGDTTFGAHLTAKGGNPGINAASTVATVPRSIAASALTTGVGGVYTCAIFPQAGFGGYSGSGTGGHSIYGGGGGGNPGGTGGTSEVAGDGGAGNNTLNTKGGNGVAPSGGGGASGNNGGGGDGARGECRVWTW